MKMRSVLSILLVLCVSVAIDISAQSGAAKGKGRIKGVVKDSEGKGIPGVTVKFSNNDLNTSFEIKTNDKGEWTVNGIAAGMWDIDFIKEGYLDKRITNQISGISFNKPVDLSLEKAQGASAGGGQKEAVPGMDLMQQGNQLRAAKDYAGAVAKYEAAIAANPSLYSAYGDIGVMYSQMDQPDKAIEAFSKLVEKDPTNTHARVDLANLWFKKGNAEEAKKVLAGLNIDQVSNPLTLYNIGVGLYNAGDIQGAIPYWEKTIALDPKMADAQFQLALAYYANKDIAKAKPAFQKVIELAPGTENAKMAQEMLDTMKE
jgi:tetratricopeptide (TPR) repeat protein